MKKIPYILFILCLILAWSCTKERGYERELVGTWSVNKYDILIDSVNTAVADSNKIELYFNGNNGFVVFIDHSDGSGVVTDTLFGTSTAFIGGGYSTLVMTYHEFNKGLAASFINEEPFPNEKFNNEFFSILHLNKDSLSLIGILDGSQSVNSITLQAIRK